ncbi:vacuolar protein sorting-associated protein 13 [Ceratobasidium sp. AG-Ba]|nr:vacuolar protein sorting-associated protein 13 [Ceratobasidium sp. AG-Ba]
MGRLELLPNEVIVRVLVLLLGDDIQKCRRVCQYLRKIIDYTKQLQYLVDLAYLGYAEPDFPRMDLDYDQKSQLMREHRLRGPAPCQTFTLNTSILRPEDTEPRLSVICGGVYAQGFSSVENHFVHDLCFYRLPSWNHGTGLESWSFNNMGMNVVQIALDPEVNLLCLVEFLDIEDPNLPAHTAYNIHLRALDTNEPHLGAALSKFTWRLQLPNTRDPHMRITIHIIGNLLGVFFLFQNSPLTLPYLVIWDWTLGLEIIEIRTGRSTGDCFTIIDQELVVFLSS